MSGGKIAKADERVVVNRDFSVLIPEGFRYSLDTNEINANRKLVFIKTERNDYYNENFGDSDDFDLSAPFSAPQCCTVVPIKNIGGQLDLSSNDVRQAMQKMFESILAMLNGVCTIVKETDDILVYYSGFCGEVPNAHFMFVTPENIYTGQIWLNDISAKEEREKIAKEWLCSFENYILTDADKKKSMPFVAPTYNEKKREQVGPLTIAVPDQMKTIGSETGSADFVAIERLKQDFAFLGVNKDFQGSFAFHTDAEFLIKAQNNGIQTVTDLSSLWGDDKKTERKNTLTGMIKNNLQGSPFEIRYKDLGKKLAVVYTQVGESDDNIEQWANFFAVFFCDTSVIQFNIGIRAVLDIPAMEEAIVTWASFARPASKEEVAEYNNKKEALVLGELVGKNGKIDAVKASQLFFEDIFFFVKGQIRRDGRHHLFKGLQLNSSVLDNYPKIKNNPDVYYKALKELLEFVEEDECLIVNEKCIHYEFDNLNQVDLPIINGVKVDVKGAEIGKGLSGIRVFLLIAWHMAKIVESQKNKYLVALDQNMYKGIPNAPLYMCQLIKRLREYNGITDDFDVMFVSVFNCDGGIDGAIEGVHPLQGDRNSKSFHVDANDNPYASVLKQIEKASQDGVWKKWRRGKNAVEEKIDENLQPLSVDNHEKLSSETKTNKKKADVSADPKKQNDYEKAKKMFEQATTSLKMKKAKKLFSELNGYLDSEDYIKKCDAEIPVLVKEEKIAAEKKAAEKAEAERIAKQKAEAAEKKRLAQKAAKEAEAKRLAEKAAKEAEEKRLAEEKARKEARKKLFSFLKIVVGIPLVLSIILLTVYSASAKIIKSSVTDNLKPVTDELRDIHGVTDVDVKICAEPKSLDPIWYLEYHAFVTVEFSDLSHLDNEKMLEILNNGAEEGNLEYSYDGNDADYAIYTRSVTDSLFGHKHPVFVTLTDGHTSYTLKEAYLRRHTELHMGDASEILKASSVHSIIVLLILVTVLLLALFALILYRKWIENGQVESLKNNLKKRKTLIIVLAIVCVIILVGFFIVKDVVVRENQYNQAFALIDAGDEAGAYAAFESLGDYKDAKDICNKYDYSKAMAYLDEGNVGNAFYALNNIDDYEEAELKIAELSEKYPYLSILDAVPGEEIVLGKYEQDNNVSNGAENIEWVVLKNENGVLYAVSKHILDAKVYNTHNGDGSTLKGWLKKDFCNAAFGEMSDGFIDKIGLLSEDDLEVYETFVNDQPEWTAYAKGQNPKNYSYGGYSWWLDGDYFHGYGSDDVDMHLVDESGFSGVAPVRDVNGVRPTIIIDCVSEDVDYYAGDYDDIENAGKVTRPQSSSGGGSSSSSKCSSCNGTGKKLVTWYSEGDWGEKSYSSYTCTACGGDGRR